MSDVLPLIITCSLHQIDRPYIQADYSDHLQYREYVNVFLTVSPQY